MKSCFADISIYIVVFGSLLWCIYKFCTVNFNYWKIKGVAYDKPVPFFGNIFDVVVGRNHAYFDQVEAYNRFKGEKYFGRFIFRHPILVLRDPDLIENVLIKYFSHFNNRSLNFDPKLDKLSLHLVNLRDQKWKCLRNTLTPAFSLKKLKSMDQTLVECSRSLVEILNKYASSTKPFEAKEIMSDYAMQVIGHCAFGLDLKTLKNPNSAFRKIGKAILFPTLRGRIRFMIRLIYPKLLKWLKWKAVSSQIEDFFCGLVKETVEARKHDGMKRQDFLQLLINLKEEDKKTIEETKGYDTNEEDNKLIIDDSVLASNIMVFVLAGYETTATTLAFCLYELAKNPEIQKKLRQNVRIVSGKMPQAILTYDLVNKIPYLQQVIAETLRKYPPVDSLARACTKDWNIPGSDLLITKGTMISVPIYSLHHDSQYFPEPDLFLPERFSDENKQNIVNGTYLPFGDGPRICIARTFAELEMKIVLATLIMRFKFTINEKTRMPLKFCGGFQRIPILLPQGGLWINIESL